MDYFSIFDNRMAEVLSFRGEDSDFPDQWAWGWEPTKSRYTTDARPKTLKEYYEMPYSDANNPFSNFVIRGENSWQDDNQLKLGDVVGGGDGAMHIRPKPHWQVKIRVTTDNEEPIATLSEPSGVTLYDAAWDSAYPNIFYTKANDEYAVTEGETWVILNGDTDDYISIDIDGEESDIGNLVIKAGGHKFSTTEYGLIDKGGYDNWAKVTLKGVFFKPSMFGVTGMIKEYGSYRIMHDAEAMRIYALKSDGSGEEVVSTLYRDLDTDAEAILEYTEGVLDKLEGSLSSHLDKDGCPPNSSYDADKEECVCHEGYMTDLFGMECVDISTISIEEEDKGCPTYSTLGSDGYCHCDDGYIFSNGVCVLDERDEDEATDYMEIVEKYGMYAVLGLGTLLVVSFLNPKK